MTANNLSSPSPESRMVTEIASGMYQLQIPLSDDRFITLNHLNSYLIQGTNGWLMIDTGWNTPLASQAVDEALKSLQIRPSDINTIIVTHAHLDHFGMVGRLKKLSPEIKLLMHRWEAEAVQTRYVNNTATQAEISALSEKHGMPSDIVEFLSTAALPALNLVSVAVPDRMLYGGETLDTGLYKFEVIWTPGHSPGHICLYEPKNRFLFCGDHLLPAITPNVSYNPFTGDNPLGDYFCALRKLQHLPVDRLFPGHEYPFTDLPGRAQSIIEHHLAREAEIYKVILHEFHNSFEIASQLTWNFPQPWGKFPPMEKRFAVNETIAHLEHMRWDGKVEKTLRDRQVLYKAI